MNTDKLNYIKDVLGDNYLYELNMDIDAENNMPAYEFIHMVYNQFEERFPELNKEYENQLLNSQEEELYSKEEIIQSIRNRLDDNLISDIFMSYVRSPNKFQVSRNFYSSSFQDKQTTILNQIKFKFGDIKSLIDYLSNNPKNNIAGFNNKELYNHISYIAKTLALQFFILNKKIDKYNKKYYFT